MNNQKVGLKERLFSSINRLSVKWFNAWQPILDEALQSLPESKMCPHILFRQIMQNPSPAQKCTALLTNEGTPVAVVGLRKQGRYSWELVTNWIIPGFLFPGKPEYINSALEAIGKDVWVAWWRVDGIPHPSKSIRYKESTPTYRMNMLDNCEQYWRNNGYFKTIRRIRNRCKSFTPVINTPGSLEWTILHWEEKWHQGSSSSDSSIQDRIIADRYLETHNKFYTIMLLDGDKPIGGATITVHGKDLVAGVLYRDPQYHSYGIGDRLVDLSFSFAAERGFETFDIGGGHEYKKKWAPQEGEHWKYEFCPDGLYLFKRVYKRLIEKL